MFNHQRPPKKPVPLWQYLVVVALVVILLGYARAITTGVSQEPRPAPTATLIEASAGIGENVTVGRVQWKVLSAEFIGDTLASGDIRVLAKDENHFLLVRVEMQNNEAQELRFQRMELLDSNLHSYGLFNEQLMVVPTDEACLFHSL